MIRRFTSAQFVPASAGAKAKNPVGSTLFSTPMVALLRHPGHKILRTFCHESARKRLISPLVGFCAAGLLLLLMKFLIRQPELYRAPERSEERRVGKECRSRGSAY